MKKLLFYNIVAHTQLFVQNQSFLRRSAHIYNIFYNIKLYITMHVSHFVVDCIVPPMISGRRMHGINSMLISKLQMAEL